MSPSAAEITHATLLDFLEQEEMAARADYEALMALPQEDRIRRGYTLVDLQVAGWGADASELLLECGEQLARYGAGDPILLVGAAGQETATVLGQDGSVLRVRTDHVLPPLSTWTAEPQFVSFADLARCAVARVDAYHGAALWQALNGTLADLATPAGLDDWAEALATLEQETGVRLEADQRAAFAAAVQTPKLWALQGPPGTGKTIVAAYAAEALARFGHHRVLVTAPSHEAVNKLLHEIHERFPQRTLVKVASSLREAAGQKIHGLTPQGFMEQRPALLKKRAIVGMTVHTALLMADIFRYRADVVLVDEASQVPLAYGAQLGLLGFSTLLFGDPAQLNAIFPAAIADELLACSILERYATIYPLQRLTLTYRLNQALADLVGGIFYPAADGRSALTPTPAAATRRLKLSMDAVDPWAEAVLAPDLPAVWVQTGERGRRQTSLLEAELIVRLVQRLARARVSGRQVAVVTPFRQQVHLLNRKLAGLRPGERPRLGTVETMQGQSVEVVLISLAASEPAYLSAVDGFYFLPNRWNVAISRARTKVVVVGSEMVLRAAQGTALGSVLTGMARMAAADGLMP